MVLSAFALAGNYCISERRIYFLCPAYRYGMRESIALRHRVKYRVKMNVSLYELLDKQISSMLDHVDLSGYIKKSDLYPAYHLERKIKILISQCNAQKLCSVDRDLFGWNYIFSHENLQYKQNYGYYTISSPSVAIKLRQFPLHK